MRQNDLRVTHRHYGVSISCRKRSLVELLLPARLLRIEVADTWDVHKHPTPTWAKINAGRSILGRYSTLQIQSMQYILKVRSMWRPIIADLADQLNLSAVKIEVRQIVPAFRASRLQAQVILQPVKMRLIGGFQLEDADCLGST